MKRPQAVILIQERDAVGTIPSTDELSRVDYCGNMVYDRGERRMLLENGYVTFDITTNTPSYHFYLRDHLGNNRVVMAGDGTVEQVTHYYPFGGVMRESTNPGLQPYKYGGKELDRTSGLDAYDFGARMYFADRLQWAQMDPMCEKYYDVSPYNYCVNNPVNASDPSGRDWIYFQYGNFMWVYFASNVNKEDDIANFYYENGIEGQYSIHYLGESGYVYNIDNGDKNILFTLNEDGTFTNLYGSVYNFSYSMVDEYGALNIGSDITFSEELIESLVNNNYYGNYLGPNNPQVKGNDFYAVPPIDELDFAAYIHDRAYDLHGASGPQGVMGNFDVVDADYDLYLRAKSISETAPKGTELLKWATRTAKLFKHVSSFKYSIKSLF